MMKAGSVNSRIIILESEGVNSLNIIMWYVYVLQSQKNKDWFYKGSTNDLKRRFRQHSQGEVQSTKFYRPFKIIYYEAYLDEKTARLREASLKKSGSVWKPLINRVKTSLDD